MFIRNCWYVAGWNDVLEGQELFACVIANEPIVIYRKSDGALAALQDRCCHRAAPLLLDVFIVGTPRHGTTGVATARMLSR